MRIVTIVTIVALVIMPLGAVAKDCETCGSTLTDKGRCPYSQPKPKERGQ